jgi:hypothetical protein
MKKNNKNWEAIHDESSKWARWIALYEAINYCADKAEEKNIPFSKLNLKPLEIMRYITSTEDTILRKILKNEYNIDVCFNEEVSTKNNNSSDEVNQEYQYSP